MSNRLTMNKELGTKWFTFYTKVRPWLACFGALAGVAQFALYPNIFISNIGLLISFVATLAVAVLSIIVAVKAGDDYEDFVSFVKGVLLFEILNMAYQSATQQYYENGYDMATSAIMGVIILLFGYLVWYRLNMKYFRKRLIQVPVEMLTTNNTTVVSANESKQVTHQQPIHMSLAEKEGEPPCAYSANHYYGADIMLQQNAELPKADPIASETQTKSQLSPQPPTDKVKTKYCSRCGKRINPTTKKCVGCGKQYFKGITWEMAITTMLMVIFIVSFIGNFVLAFRNVELTNDIKDLETCVASLKEDNAALKSENEQYYEYYEDSFRKEEFIDSHIVFIENDGSNWYHRYECARFIGNDYWAHNTEYAEYIGYTPCPYCFD